MELRALTPDFSVCRVKSLRAEDLAGDFWFAARTDEELSLVCRTECVPRDALRREDGWKAFRIQGELDFSLVGVLAPIAGILAAAGISLFAVSTYNTDYVLVKADAFMKAAEALRAAGYTIV